MARDLDGGGGKGGGGAEGGGRLAGGRGWQEAVTQVDSKVGSTMCYYFILFFFPTGLVRHYIAGLPLRFCPDHWATFCRGVPHV